MKKILSLLVLLPIMVVSQTQTENYIKTTTYKTPTNTSISNPAITQANQNITYFDGLGRPTQQIAHQQSGSGKDIVTPIEYDTFGRQDKEYLPYVPTSTASLNYKTTALADVFNFTPYLGQNPYSQKQMEASPLNRVLKQAAPGTDWALGSSHEIKLDYQTNVANEVKLFTATATWNSTSGLYDISLGNASGATFYDPNQLYKTITYDENTAATPTEANGSTVEFKNKQGQVVLKRTYDNTIAHDTYYVYDDYGNLTYVVPPKADATINTAILDDLCYQYKYDSRNRLVEKKLPGKQWEFIVYDKLDRVVATGPTFSPFSDSAVGAVGWMITKYDVFNRPVYTGWELSATITSADRKTKQNTMDGLTTLSESKTTTPTTIDSLTGIAYYTNNVVPTSFKLLTINYYDDYDFQAFTSAIAYTTPVAYNNSTLKPRGLPTGSWVRVPSMLAATTAESSYILYDAKARPVKTFSTNYLGGYTQIDSNLDTFSGRLNYTETRHKRLSGDTELYIKEAYTYSTQDRLITHTHQIGVSGTPQLLVSNTYDELGQLISKNVGNTVSNPLQKVDYAYNIRGWLTGINNDPTNNLVLNTNEKDVFAFKINYNTTAGSVAGVSPLYNGNISETYYRTGSDNVLRKYGYQYDNLNRLKNAIYQKPGGNTYPTYEDYSEKNITYDKNGNIQTLYRNGDLENALPSNQIDNLSYTYQANSNKLALVYDSSNNTSGFKDGNLVGDDYTYDSNGNLIIDKNKGITAIIYNHLNLPTKITFGTKGTISYLYNAVGQKLQKDVNPILTGLTRAKTVYSSGFQYIETTRISKPPRPPGCARLQYFPTAEGYVENTAGFCATEVYSYVYNYADHLGNVRLSYKDTDKNGAISSNEILEENNYYPFGMKHNGYNSNNIQTDYRYKFSGREWQDELQLNMYDLRARQYDPAIARFVTVDPLTDEDEQLDKSNYAYAWNDPIKYNDPDGECPSCFLGALVGAAVDYGEQVATNYVEGKENPFTNNINLVSIGT
ncbi:MAG: RHS repeat-associated core domain-containing protein, partial [Flavobacteriaceae bacterium]|nr:RHS repeat-associated core domain-containing protein [Flavobacteriaceae bacterium]